MSTATYPYEIPRPVARKVSRLRLLVRLYSLAEGIAAVAIVVGLAFWLGLTIDWLLEPSRAVRVALEALVAAATLFAAWKYIGRRFLAPLPADSLALLVERQYPELQEGLVTTVQAASYTTPYSPHHAPPNSPDLARSGLRQSTASRELINATSRRAAAAVEQVRLRRVFDMRPLARKGAAATALLAALAAFALIQPDSYSFW